MLLAAYSAQQIRFSTIFDCVGFDRVSICSALHPSEEGLILFKAIFSVMDKSEWILMVFCMLFLYGEILYCMFFAWSEVFPGLGLC